MKRAGLLFVTVGVLVGLCTGWGVARGAEPPAAHGERTQQVIHLGAERVAPANLDMSKDDVLVFENHALYPLAVTFTDPAEQADKIRCGLVHEKAAKTLPAPWALFEWDGQKRLSAKVPSGRFASVCSLAPGQYVFTVDRVGGVAAGGHTAAATTRKGAITVK